jgi:UDP-2,3-diacylglucosamine pyrophosphatase LpxH
MHPPGAMTDLWIASDWHLGPQSPAVHGRLALAFLESAQAAGVELILNGDIFDDLFAGPGRAQAAHPDVATVIEALAASARLRRTAGNHDPDAGPERIVLQRPVVGRVLVTHGHSLDSINSSLLGRLGDAISRGFGRTALVRGAAKLAEAAARAVAGRQMVAVFRARCVRAVEEGGFDLGLFGHVHRPHHVAGDRYANAGGLHHDRLEYAVIDDRGARLASIRS